MNMSHPLASDPRLIDGLTMDSYIKTMEQQALLNADDLPDEEVEKLEFTKLNLHRTGRILRTYKVSEDLSAMVQTIDDDQLWVIITEPWCGDSAQCVPYFSALADLNPKIDLRLVLRDENPDIMDAFLTEGKRSIPILVVFDALGKVLFTWGPRPAEAQKVFLKAKAEGLGKPDILERLHLFYGRNRGKALEAEFKQILGG